MTKKKAFLLSMLLLSIVGSLLHGAYDFFGHSKLIGLFVPVNESTWEHMKLFFFPALFLFYFLYTKFSSTIPVLCTGLSFALLLGTWLISVLFYSYRGILGLEWAVFDISTYYLSVLLSFGFLWSHYFSDCAIVRNKSNHNSKLLPILVIIQGILFIYFTYRPLSLGIFVDPTR